MKLYHIVSLMNLSNCQSLNLTAVSPSEATGAPRAPEIHKGSYLLKSTVELSSGKMCSVLDGDLWKQTSRQGLAWRRFIRTGSCEEMRKAGLGRAEEMTYKTPWLRPQPSCQTLYC